MSHAERPQNDGPVPAEGDAPVPRRRNIPTEDGTFVEVTDGRRTVVCVAYHRETLIVRTPYEGKVLDILSTFTFGKSAEGRAAVFYRIVGLRFVPDLYSRVWGVMDTAPNDRATFEAAKAAILFYMQVDAPNADHVVV